MYITRSELVSEIREVRTHIKTEINVLEGLIKDLTNDNQVMRRTLEAMNQQIIAMEKLCSKL